MAPISDRIVDARTHMIRALSDLGEAIREDDKELAERQARELRRQRFLHMAGPRFASDDDAAPDRARAMSSGATPCAGGVLPLRPRHRPPRRRARLP